MTKFHDDVEVKDLPSLAILKEYNDKYDMDNNSIYTIISIKDTATHLVKAMDLYFEEFGLTTAKFTVLMYLNREDEKGLLPSQLAEMTGLTRGSITTLIANLEKSDLVIRKRESDDRRQVNVYMTDNGKQLLNDVLPIHFKNTKLLLKNLKETQKKEMLEAMKLIELGIKEFSADMEEKNECIRVF